jgi:hypothetical protein
MHGIRQASTFSTDKALRSRPFIDTMRGSTPGAPALIIHRSRLRCGQAVSASKQARCRAIRVAALDVPICAVDARRRIGRARASRSIGGKLKCAAIRVAIIDLTVHFGHDLDWDLAAGLHIVFGGRGACPIVVVVHQLHIDAIRVFRAIGVAGSRVTDRKREAAVQEAGCAQVVPGHQFFMCAPGIGSINSPITVAARARCGSAVDVSVGRSVIAW